MGSPPRRPPRPEDFGAPVVSGYIRRSSMTEFGSRYATGPYRIKHVERNADRQHEGRRGILTEEEMARVVAESGGTAGNSSSGVGASNGADKRGAAGGAPSSALEASPVAAAASAAAAAEAAATDGAEGAAAPPDASGAASSSGADAATKAKEAAAALGDPALNVLRSLALSGSVLNRYRVEYGPPAAPPGRTPGQLPCWTLRCWDPATSEECVLVCFDKPSPEVAARDPVAARTKIMRLKNEVTIMDVLAGHRHMLLLRDVFETPSSLQLVTELCAGGRLDEVIARRGPPPEHVTARLFRGLLKAVLHAHACGVQHRAIRPAHIFLHVAVPKSRTLGPVPGDGGRAAPASWDLDDATLKLTGWSFGVFFQQGTPLTQQPTGQVRGPAMAYMAPEQLQRGGGEFAAAAAPLGPEVDSWAAGAVLYFLLTGCAPFHAASPESLLREISTGLFNAGTIAPRGVTLPGADAWNACSNEAKSLVRALMRVEPRTRLTPREALMLPWLQDETHIAREHAAGGGRRRAPRPAAAAGGSIPEGAAAAAAAPAAEPAGAASAAPPSPSRPPPSAPASPSPAASSSSPGPASSPTTPSAGAADSGGGRRMVHAGSKLKELAVGHTVELFVDSFRRNLSLPFLRVLHATTPETVISSSEELYRGLGAVEQCFVSVGAQLTEGPYFLGEDPGMAEASAAPVALRMLAALPAIRSLDLLEACKRLGAPRLLAWFQAVKRDPHRAADMSDLTVGGHVATTLKLHVQCDFPSPPPSTARLTVAASAAAGRLASGGGAGAGSGSGYMPPRLSSVLRSGSFSKGTATVHILEGAGAPVGIVPKLAASAPDWAKALMSTYT